MQRFDRLIAPGSGIHADNIERRLAFDHDEALQKVLLKGRVPKNIFPIDLERLVRTKFGLEKLGHRACFL
jgi:hypothetical protein